MFRDRVIPPGSIVFWSGLADRGDILLKMSDTDLQLLERYTRQHAEDAFAELVRRHLNLVFSAALRQVRSPQLAEEVAQSVFTDLARQAHHLAPDTVLSAWLYQVTRRTAIDVVRREARRQVREQVACELNAMNATASDWTHIEPLLDEAMHALAETDRTAILLRYFENKSLREVGQTLGTNEDAARKRVSRAVERLREFFAKRGVSVGTSGLVVVISANAVQAAPAGLAVTIATAAALAGTTIATTATATATKAIAMTTLQKTIIGATLAAALGTGIYEAREASTLRSQVQELQQRQAEPLERIQQLSRERDGATRQLAALRDEHERLIRKSAELVKVRDEVVRLRREGQEFGRLHTTNDAMTGLAEKWLKQVTELKQLVEQRPELRIPELQFLTADDWLRLAQSPGFEFQTEDGIRATLAEVRHHAKGHLVSRMGDALFAYVATNNGQLPNDILQLKPYFDSPVEDAMLQRYTLQRTGRLGDYSESEPLIIEKAPVDDEFDYLSSITAYGSSCQGIGRLTGGGSSSTWGTNLTARIKPSAK